MDVQNNHLYKGNTFPFVGDDGHLFIFPFKNNLKLLKCAERVFKDGAFSYASKHFVDSYTIRVY